MILIGLVSCDEAEFTSFDEQNEFIQFQNTNFSIGEGNETATVTVLLGSGSNDNGVTVNFTVTSDQTTRFNVTPANGVLVIPAGEFTADIVVESIDNLLVDGSFDVTIDLGASDLPIGLAGEGSESASATVAILDDDCPVDTAGFEGTYMVEEVFTAGANEGLALANAFGEAYQVDITLDPNDSAQLTLILNNSPGFNEYFPDGTVVIINACPGTITFQAGNPSVAAFSTMVLDDPDNSSSSFDDTNFVLQGDGALGGFGPYQFVLTRM